MNWRIIAISTVITICLFGFLATAWYSMTTKNITIMLPTITVTPRDQ
jgi:hypothetical protein